MLTRYEKVVEKQKPTPAYRVWEKWRALITQTENRPSKFIVLADSMKSAINVAWDHGGPDFRSRFEKSTAQAQEMKEGALRVL